MGNILTKDEILQADDLPTEIVPVPEWGGDVMVRTMTGKDRDELETSIVSDPNKRDLTNLRAKIVAFSVVGEDGKRLFTSEDVLALGEKNARALDRIFGVAQRLSGFTQRDVEELTKNSSPSPGGETSGG